MELKREHVEWLSIIRYQSDLAENQAKGPEPLNAISISTIHDAVESMLGLIAEVHQVATPNKDFAKLFDAVSNHIKTQSCDLSGHRSAMIALNSARVAFKHHGNQSNKQTIDRHIANGLNFLADAAEQGLNTPFAEVSLLGFVRDPTVREYIRRADDYSSGTGEEDRMLAFQYLRLSFEALVQGYQQSKRDYPGRPLIRTKPSFLPSVFEIRDHGGKIGEKAFEWLENLDRWLRILVLGIDVQEYTFFLAYTPGVDMMNNRAHLNWRPGSDLSDEVFRRCRHFVVESAIRLGRRDFVYDAWNVRQSLPQDQRNMGISNVMVSDENGLLIPYEGRGDASSAEEAQYPTLNRHPADDDQRRRLL